MKYSTFYLWTYRRWHGTLIVEKERQEMTTKTYTVPGTSWQVFFYTDPQTGQYMRHIVADDAHIRQPAVEGCKRCETDAYVPHFNCQYGGNAVGHSASHCTADACY